MPYPAEAKYLCYHSFGGQFVGTLRMAQLLAQPLTSCNDKRLEHAIVSHYRGFLARPEVWDRQIAGYESLCDRLLGKAAFEIPIYRGFFKTVWLVWFATEARARNRTSHH